MTDETRRWRQLALLAVVQLLAMSVWFAGTAVAPALRQRLALTSAESGWLTSTVQLGFVAGTLLAAALNLADILPLRWYVAGCALLAALMNALLVRADSFPLVLASRALTGMALAGVYPPAMKMAATWFRSGRGLAIGAVVGALNIGKAMPYLLEGGSRLAFDTVVIVPSIAAIVAAVAVAGWYRDGPYAFPARPFSWRLIAVVSREPALRRITGGYLGHMWELYAFWTWIPAFLAASFIARGHDGTVGGWPFACVAIGAVGAIWGGIVRRSAGAGPRRSHGVGGERQLLRRERADFRWAHLGRAPDLPDLGYRGRGRLGPILGADDRTRAAARRGHGADAADVARISAHCREHSGGAGACGCSGLALGDGDVESGSGGRNREHPPDRFAKRAAVRRTWSRTE